MGSVPADECLLNRWNWSLRWVKNYYDCYYMIVRLPERICRPHWSFIVWPAASDSCHSETVGVFSIHYIATALSAHIVVWIDHYMSMHSKFGCQATTNAARKEKFQTVLGTWKQHEGRVFQQVSHILMAFTILCWCRLRCLKVSQS
jgi:hypothetical protein